MQSLLLKVFLCIWPQTAVNSFLILLAPWAFNKPLNGILVCDLPRQSSVTGLECCSWPVTVASALVLSNRKSCHYASWNSLDKRGIAKVPVLFKGAVHTILINKVRNPELPVLRKLYKQQNKLAEDLILTCRSRKQIIATCVSGRLDGDGSHGRHEVKLTLRAQS